MAQVNNVQDAIEQLTADVADETTIKKSAAVLIQGFTAQLAAAIAAAKKIGVTTAELKPFTDLKAALDDNHTELAAAIQTGVPVTPATKAHSIFPDAKGTAKADQAPPALAPTVPFNLVATPGSGSVTMTWSTPTEAAKYSIKSSLVNGGPYTPINPAQVFTPTFIAPAKSGVPVFYVVSAFNDLGHESDNSTEVTATAL